MPELDLQTPAFQSGITDADVEAVSKWLHGLVEEYVKTCRPDNKPTPTWKNTLQIHKDRYMWVVRRVLESPHPLLRAAVLRGPGPVSKAVEF
jgi:hypothetical protein